MLSIPNGFRRSESAHNIDHETFLDWVETTTLISEDELSPTDIVDFLIEEQLYDDQTFATDFVSSGWDDIRRRLSWLGAQSPISFDDRWMIRNMSWPDCPAYSFCLIVSYGPRYSGWHDDFGPDYTKQGELFELVTLAAMQAQFSGWEFLHTGWSRDRSSRLLDVVAEITSQINEQVGDIDQYSSDRANESGVDLVWNLPFADERGGSPVYLAQCASGKNWVNKVGEPNVNEWCKIVKFPICPNKAFSLPFSLSDRDLRRQTTRAGGLLLDRYRLLAHNVLEDKWVPDVLRQELVDWLNPRVDWILER